MQDAQARPFSRRLMGWVATLTIQAVVFLALLEVVARIFDPIGISYYNESARLFDAMIIEEPIGYRLPPGLKDEFYGVPVEVNDLGMRDRPVPREKAPGEFRILAMGDSVIFSVGVALEDSIPLQLEDIANANAPPGRKYRVLNMGVPSYNTVQELEQLKEVGQYLQPDAAFLFIIPNDIHDKMWVYRWRDNVILDYAQRSYALGLVFYMARWVANSVGVVTNPNVIAKKKSDEKVAADVGDDEIPATARRKRTIEEVLALPGWQNIENSLVEINRILKARGVPLLVFHRRSFRSTYVARLHQLGQRDGFAVRMLDVWGDPRYEDYDMKEYFNSPTDSHCNPRGCKLYASLIYEMLEEEGLLK